MFTSMVEARRQAESAGSTYVGFKDIDPETGPSKIQELRM
jgi:hypothetical protein